jgi:hypothetical protein
MATMKIETSDRGRLVSALSVHGHDDWDEDEIALYADAILDMVDIPLDAQSVAHVVWTMGAGKKHSGCRYDGPDANDGDYTNSCTECEEWLTGIATRVLVDLAQCAFEFAPGVRCQMQAHHDEPYYPYLDYGQYGVYSDILSRGTAHQVHADPPPLPPSNEWTGKERNNSLPSRPTFYVRDAGPLLPGHPPADTPVTTKPRSAKP